MSNYVPEKYTCVAVLSKSEKKLADALFEYLKKEVPVFADHFPRVFTKKSDVAEKLDYVSEYDPEDAFYIVISDRARTYARSMEDVHNARRAFIAGWEAATGQRSSRLRGC